MGDVRTDVRTLVKARSGGRCEAEILLRGAWRRCGVQATEVHHILTRARGGKSLDRVGETYHLIHLCSQCHKQGHEDPDSLLVMRGQVTWDKILQRPVYKGPDEYLTGKYGEQDE